MEARIPGETRRNILVCLIHNLDNRHLTIPTGAAFISAALKRESLNVFNYVWDLSKSDQINISRLEETISRNGIDVVMCGGLVFDYKTLRQIFLTAKKASPSTITVQGGCFVSYSPNQAMELLPECDLGVIGEGDITICELMDAIERGKSIANVKGIIYRDSRNNLAFTENRTQKPDLETLPIPDIESFFGDWLIGHEAYMITSGRGCNHACTFCTKLDSKYRERPLERVFEELDYYVSKYSIRGLRIVNEYFNVEEHYLDAFCKKIKGYGLPSIIQTRISPSLTPRVLKLLRDSGVTEIAFGLESADDAVLSSMKKGITSGLMLKVLKDVKATRIKAIGSFIFGDPAENNETVKRTLDFVKEHRDLIHTVYFHMIRICPGSALYDNAVSDGRIDPMAHIIDQCPPVNISNLSDDEYAWLNNYHFIHFLANHFDADLNIKNVTMYNDNDSNNRLFEYECVSCGKKFEHTVEYSKLRLFDCKFFCDCGEVLVLDFFHHIIDKDKVLNMIRKHRTAFYGSGRVFYKLFHKCGLSDCPKNEFFLLDGGLALAWSAGDKHISIRPPDAIVELDIEKVIVTISGEYDLDGIITDLIMRYPKTEFYKWYEV